MATQEAATTGEEVVKGHKLVLSLQDVLRGRDEGDGFELREVCGGEKMWVFGEDGLKRPVLL
jgi:hypothetical protein